MMDGRGPLLVVDIVVPEAELVRRLAARDDLRRLRRQRARRADARSPRALQSTAASAAAARSMQRADDNDGVVRERLKVYQRADGAAGRLLPARPTFRSVNGAQAPDGVAADLAAAVDARARASEAVRR